MNADSYYSIGKSHTVCQDYARAGTFRAGPDGSNFACALLSDGCSSSPDSDIGARLVVLSTMGYLADGLGLTTLDSIMGTARKGLPRGLTDTSLDATLLAARWDAETDPIVRALGDGVVVFKCKGDFTVIHDIDAGNFPPYPSYLLDDSRMRVFEKTGHVRVDRYVQGELEDNVLLSGSECFQGLLFRPPPEAELEAVFLLSDGVHSFQHTETFEPIPMLEIVGKLMDIKSYTGAFVERRCKFFEHREMPKLKWQHTDDFSMAGIHTGD